MKKHFSLLVAVVALAVTAPAAAKGPDQATLTGPGLDGPIIFGGSGESAGTPLGDLTVGTGFFAAMFGQTPDPMLARSPTSDLGPRYKIVYRVPGPSGTDRLRQDLYPYAKGGPVSYTRPGQPFFGTERTHGGWYRAQAGLKQTLVAAGLRPLAPSGSTRKTPVAAGLATAAPIGSTGDGSFPFIWPALATAAVVLALIAAVVVRHRRRPSDA